MPGQSSVEVRELLVRCGVLVRKTCEGRSTERAGGQDDLEMVLGDVSEHSW